MAEPSINIAIGMTFSLRIKTGEVEGEKQEQA